MIVFFCGTFHHTAVDDWTNPCSKFNKALIKSWMKLVHHDGFYSQGFLFPSLFTSHVESLLVGGESAGVNTYMSEVGDEAGMVPR